MCLPTRSPSRVETGEGRAGGRQWRRRASIHRPAKALPYLPFATDDGWPHLSVACCACSFIPCAGRLNYLHVASETCCCCAPDATSFHAAQLYMGQFGGARNRFRLSDTWHRSKPGEAKNFSSQQLRLFPAHFAPGNTKQIYATL